MNENSPVEHAEQLHDAFFPTRGPDRGDLYREAMNAAIVTVDREAPEVRPVRSGNVESVGEVTDANVVRVVVLMLCDQKSQSKLHLLTGGHRGSGTYLEILARDLDLVKLLVMELDKPMADSLQIRSPCLGVELSFITITPRLQALDVIPQRGL